MPEYMATHEKDSIFGPKKSPFSWGNNAEGTTYYEFLLSHAERLKRINVAMTTQEVALPVLGMLPFTSLLETDANPLRAFIVDVAGGRVGARAKDNLTSGGNKVNPRLFLGLSRVSGIYQNKRFFPHHQAYALVNSLAHYSNLITNI